MLNQSSFLVQNVLLNFRRTEQAVLTFSRPIGCTIEKVVAELEKRDFRSCDAVINTTLITHIHLTRDTLENAPESMRCSQHLSRSTFYNL